MMGDCNADRYENNEDDFLYLGSLGRLINYMFVVTRASLEMTLIITTFNLIIKIIWEKTEKKYPG